MHALLYPDQITPYFEPGSAAEKQFNWEATQAFCTGLDARQGLARGLRLVREHMPVDVLLAAFLPRGSTTIVQCLAGDSPAGMPAAYEYFLPEDRRKAIFAVPGDFVRVCDEEGALYVADVLFRQLGGGPWSMLFFRLYESELDVICNLVACCRGQGRYGLREAGFLHALGRPLRIFLPNAYEYIRTVEQNRVLASSNRLLRKSVSAERVPLERLPGLAGVREQIVRVAPQECPVLILGETGVGKEAVADALHERSGRAQAPLVKVNCGAIPEHLVDSELFGHEKGAFTSALSSRAGRFERAHKGSLLLDEIGELPLLAQTRLLRVLQTGELDRVGGSRTMHVDVRVFAATNADLGERIRQGSFREDLLYRLNVFPLLVPPLRQRPEDIPVLARAMLRHLAESARLPVPELAAGEVARLCSYAWPGNVRELKNMMERAFIHWAARPDKSLHIRLPGEESGRAAPSAVTERGETGPFPSLDEVMDAHIRRALRLAGGRINGPGGAARLLGINPSTLRSRMDKLGIPYGVKAGVAGLYPVTHKAAGD